MMSKRNILIIEDEKPIRTMLRYALEMSEFQVLEAGDAKQAQKLLEKTLPDLIVLDWMLPSMNGIEFTKILKKDEMTRDIPIIILTAKAQEDSKIKGLEVGADDYVVKPFSPRELIARIKAVLRRGVFLDEGDLLTAGNLILNKKSQRVSVKDQILKLGPLEYRLLHFFMTHRDRVYSRDELLSHVWGVNAYVDERTVDVHIRRLRKQLATTKHDYLIQTIHRSGYRFSEKTDVK